MNIEDLKDKLDDGSATAEYLEGSEENGITLPATVKITIKQYDPNTGEEASPHVVQWTEDIIQDKLERYQRQVDSMDELLTYFS